VWSQSIDIAKVSVFALFVNWPICAIGVAAVLINACSQSAPVSSWSQDAGFRSAEVRPGTGGKPGFTWMDPKVTGVWSTNTLQGDAYATNAVAHNGAGVAIGDVVAIRITDVLPHSLRGTLAARVEEAVCLSR